MRAAPARGRGGRAPPAGAHRGALPSVRDRRAPAGRRTMRCIPAALLAALLASPAAAQRRDEQTYYPGSFNWAFLHRYPQAARLFNAFDYGHAVLYEELYLEPGAPVDRLQARGAGFHK